MAIGFYQTYAACVCPGLLLRPPDARWLYVMAHGAGAGMRHPFLEAMAQALARRAVATYRFEFPYMAAGLRRPDRPSVLHEAVRRAVAHAAASAPGLTLFAGGKSMGGRMTSEVAAGAGGGLPAPVHGLIFLGFPLHPPRRPSDARAAHLPNVALPMLFLQGTRDALADLSLLEPVCRSLGPRATLHIVDGADHSFHVPRRSGRSDANVVDELAATIAAWATRVAP